MKFVNVTIAVAVLLLLFFVPLTSASAGLNTFSNSGMYLTSTEYNYSVKDYLESDTEKTQNTINSLRNSLIERDETESLKNSDEVNESVNESNLYPLLKKYSNVGEIIKASDWEALSQYKAKELAENGDPFNIVSSSSYGTNSGDLGNTAWYQNPTYFQAPKTSCTGC